METNIILDKLIHELNAITKEKYDSNQDFWQLFCRHQQMIESEVLECLLILNRAYARMFYLVRIKRIEEALHQLKIANSIKNKFEFDKDTATIFKIIAYPYIAYLQYKIKNIRSAQYYTTRTINLIKSNNYRDPIFMFRIIQQKANYTSLYFATGAFEKGINYSLESIIACYDIMNDCENNHNYYKDYKDDIMILHMSNVVLLSQKLISGIEENRNDIVRSNGISWKLITTTTELLSHKFLK